MSATAWNLTTSTAPYRVPFGAVALRPAWSEAEKAAYALQVARNNLAALEVAYTAACAALGAANRRPAMRRYWQGKAFVAINAARKQLRQARAALAAAMTCPALVSDQVAA